MSEAGEAGVTAREVVPGAMDGRNLARGEGNRCDGGTRPGLRHQSANLRKHEYFQAGAMLLGESQPEDDDNFFVQILETCTCVNQQ